MQNHLTSDLLKSIVHNNSVDYKKRSPFPHLMYDGLFPIDVLQAAELEIPDKPSTKNGCVKGADQCFKGANQLKKNAFVDEGSMGPATATLFAFMKSSTFIKFLEQMTGSHILFSLTKCHAISFVLHTFRYR